MQKSELIHDILQRAKVEEMPKPLSEIEKDESFNEIWVRAIGKIRKANYTEGYAIVNRSIFMEPNIVYINGSQSIIHSIIELYPFEFLDKRKIKKFRGNEIEQRIEYLRNSDVKIMQQINLEGMSIDEINKLIVGVAVYNQLNNK